VPDEDRAHSFESSRQLAVDGGRPDLHPGASRFDRRIGDHRQRAGRRDAGEFPDGVRIVRREPGDRRKRALVQGERPRHRLATGIGGEHRLPTEQGLQQLEGESWHRALELGGTLLVGGACRIHRTAQGGDGVVDPGDARAFGVPGGRLGVSLPVGVPGLVAAVGRHTLHQRAR
jgi:hypothetical protein